MELHVVYSERYPQPMFHVLFLLFAMCLVVLVGVFYC